jgi:murein DD-endopeptidase MepM/ murein hydrolase activator NlpD
MERADNVGIPYQGAYMSVYSVRSGDTLSQIAQRSNTTVDQLAKTNDIENVDQIQAGQQLRIPGQKDEFTTEGAQGVGGPALTGQTQSPDAATPVGETQGAGGTDAGMGAQPAGGTDTTQALDTARGLIGREYGDPAGASGEAVGPDSPFMHCAQFVNAVYSDLPPRAPELEAMSTPGLEPKAGDVLASTSPAPWGHVGIMTEKGTVIHSIPGVGVHESSLAEFEASSPVTGVIPR